MTDKKDVLRTVDEPARRLGRTLVRSARHGALASLLAETSEPLCSRVLVASDPAGHPLLLVSRLSSHTGALLADPRCSLLFGEPSGDGDPLSQPRISVQGDAERLDGVERTAARTRFLARHPDSELYCDFGDFLFLRVLLREASLNGGFARAYRLVADDLLDSTDREMEERLDRAITHMNEDHAEAVDAIAHRHAGEDGTGWRIATADRSGIELSSGSNLRRVFFDVPIARPEDIRSAFVTLAKGSA